MPDVRTLIAEVGGRRGLGGVGVALVRRGHDPELSYVGLAETARAREVGPDTVFRIASITKTMTAVAVMQLRDAGALDLDDPVNDYLKDMRIETPPESPAVTFRHLLTHTAGIGEMPRVFSFFRRAAWGSGPPGAPLGDIVSVYDGVLRTELAAGAKWAYANHGFVVLGKLVEDISGKPLDEYLSQHLFGPLGMAHTGLRRTPEVANHLAQGHFWLLGRYRPARDYDLTLLGAGSVLSTLPDMARYASWLLAGGSEDVLAPSTLTEMTLSQHAVAPGVPGTGLCFALGECGTFPVFGHDGNMPDFASVLMVVPEAGVAVVVLTNTGTVLGANQLAVAILRGATGVPDPVQTLQARPILDPPQRWASLTGYYAPRNGFLTNVRTWQMLGGEAQVVVRGRHLVMRALTPVRALRKGVTLRRTDEIDPSRYAFDYEGMLVPVVFESEENGRAERVCIGRPINVVLHRRPAARSSRVHVRLAGAAIGLLVARLGRRRKPRDSLPG